MAIRNWGDIPEVLVGLLILVPFLSCGGAESGDKTHVFTLDHSNFSKTVSQHDFIVVEFYAPWCGHCKNLAPEYERAASILSKNDPPVSLAKVDASDEANIGIASDYKIQGFPTIKILRNGGKTIQEYKGPRESDGIVEYLKRQVGPASVEIKSVQDADNLIDDKKISIVGVFPEFSGEEYNNFTTLAEKLCSDYDFGHTTNAKFLPRGDIVNRPTLRLFKPFAERFVDFQDFQVDEMEKFIEEASVPVVTIFDNEPENFEYLNKFFDSPKAKTMVFVNFTTDLDAFKSKYNDVAKVYKGKNLSFLLGDIDAGRNALEYFGLKEDQAPLIIIQNPNRQKYLKTNIEPDQISAWLNDYKAGNLKPFTMSEPIPEVNDEPVKVVVTDSLEDMVLKSEKNEFYAPWCGHCKNLAPTLVEVATSFEDDDDIIIAKFDATANDITNDIFDVQGFPTLYFRSASGKIVHYNGDRTKQDIIDFIDMYRDRPAQVDSSQKGSAISDSAKADAVKDEL